jgi:outer membrane protein OmpA-like peptidoglycan-associated protein
MKKLLLTYLLLAGLNLAWADTPLQFPTTEADIIKALTPKPTRQKKGFNAGKGLKAIKADQPKIGALIQFDFDSAVIKPESYSLLREFSNALQNALSAAKIEINGHTDNIGSISYNLDLSKRRAQAVKQYLVSVYGIAEHRLTIKANGKTQPIESNDTEQGRALNRRVEFIRMEN